MLFIENPSGDLVIEKMIRVYVVRQQTPMKAAANTKTYLDLDERSI
jgi:hypothetical protein